MNIQANSKAPGKLASPVFFHNNIMSENVWEFPDSQRISRNTEIIAHTLS